MMVFMPIIDEELLEPIARYLRFITGIKHIDKSKPITLVDLGCGPKIRFYHFAKKHQVEIKRYLGVDPLISPALTQKFDQDKIVSIINHPLIKTIDIKDKTVDYAVAFAFFEHIDHPKEIMAEGYRILKLGGKLILTVPSPKAKSFLEFMSYQLGIISSREIEEHQRYFDKQLLLEYLPKNIKSSQIHHHYFEFGLNNLLVVTKE